MGRTLCHAFAIGLSGAFACLSACSKLDVPKPSPTSVDAATTSASIAGVRQWYTYGRKSSYGQKTATAQRGLQEVVPRSVAIDWHAAVTDHEYVMAPLVDNNNPFADAHKFGYRYLVVRRLNESDYDGRLVEFVVSDRPQNPAEAATTALNGARPYLLGHGPGPIANFTGWFLTYSPDYVYESGWVYQDGNQQQQQVQMEAAIKYEIIDNDAHNPDPATKLLAILNCVTTTVCGSVTVANSGNPTVNCASSTRCSSYTIDLGEAGSTGGGTSDTGWGGGGTGTSGPAGQGPGPASVPNMPPTMTMPKQATPAGCVPASLAQVKMALCGGNGQTALQIFSAMLLYGAQTYGCMVIQDGFSPSETTGIIDHFFDTDVITNGDYQTPINNGHPIITDIFISTSGSTAVYHNVLSLATILPTQAKSTIWTQKQEPRKGAMARTC